jgi:hypothetical protein
LLRRDKRQFDPQPPNDQALFAITGFPLKFSGKIPWSRFDVVVDGMARAFPLDMERLSAHMETD